MKATKLVSVLIVLAAVVFLAVWIRRTYSPPPEVPFARVKRDTLVSTLSTNGKVEPYEWISVRAERVGLVARVRVERGERIEKGAVIAELDASVARSDLAAAEARVAQARAELDVVQSGGRAAEVAQIESGLAEARRELERARKEYESFERLAAKQAATRQEVADARYRMEQAQAQIQALERKRAALVSQADRTAAEARLREALAAREQAARRIEQSQIRAPMGGILYELATRVGAYLSPGDLVASIGRLEKVRVHVYVDEPELGRVSEAMPVTITWDALPGQQWKGLVEKTPTQVVSLGTRQVGEVICTIENPGLELLPGTNVNAEIQTQVVKGGLVIPKEAVRREQDRSGVYVLENGNVVDWRPVKLGSSSLTRTQILEGVSEGDAVALATDRPLQDGERVNPVFP